VDAKGKIVAYVFGAPPRFEATMRAHYSSGVIKAANAVAHGALGMVLLYSPALEELYPFKDRVRDLVFPEKRWMDAQGRPNDYFPELRGTAVMNMAAAAKVFQGSGKSADEIYAAAKSGRPSSLALPVSARIRVVSKLEDIHSPNVVARLKGSDSKLSDEYVVYTAHLDHLGIGEAVNGDKIYNGALDNASGSACLLEVARAYSRMKPRARRSILFVSVTGEEDGLLGSAYFAHHPTVAKDHLVADINVDANLALLWPIADVTARGREHSTLGAAVREAGARLNFQVSPDPLPELVLFIRSDQYSFVKEGIPAVLLSTGIKSSNPKIKPDEILPMWMRTLYHKPQDDMNQRFDFESGAKFTRYCFLVGYVVARQDERPTWNPGDFFGEQYGNRH